MTYDYRPMYGGAHYDPEPAGGQVTSLSLYDGPDRTTLVAGTGPGVRLRAGVYRFALPDVPPGRYWATVAFTPSEGSQPVKDQSLRLDLPLGLGLVTSPEAVAGELGMPLPLTPEQRDDLLTAIRKAQADVVAYLGQPVIPQLITRTALTPYQRGRQELEDAESWPFEADDLVQVSAYRDRGDGTYDVDFLVGFDGAANDAVVRYVTTHAAEAERLRPGGVGAQGRRVSSVSAEGQSISYESAPTTGQAGSLPELSSLSRWKRRLFQPLNRPARPPWPYSTTRYRRF
ncbi:hypothetical protein [Streptomyces griseomycini]|uniref:Uncharacterized protein n=1 Tax=Streptomyces griseomycini TaxID=66895 RepID=A0A7W7PWK2_9ACTN|nr:hypothetical protein [Streptomyces griseomycini]MBB4902513.1 hypothetical protein [Streptomyces griseomycini]GGR52146.1 hypothetical protein GCM10015536_67050 [Streptomyces griseomycini]